MNHETRRGGVSKGQLSSSWAPTFYELFLFSATLLKYCYYMILNTAITQSIPVTQLQCSIRKYTCNLCAASINRYSQHLTVNLGRGSLYSHHHNSYYQTEIKKKGENCRNNLKRNILDHGSKLKTAALGRQMHIISLWQAPAVQDARFGCQPPTGLLLTSSATTLFFMTPFTCIISCFLALNIPE